MGCLCCRNGSTNPDDPDAKATVSAAKPASANFHGRDGGGHRDRGFYPERVNLAFNGELWFWKGPAPWHFITIPVPECDELEAASAFVTYGWGMIPVTAQIGGTEWKTSLFPKDERYIVPVKAHVRKAEGLEVGDVVAVRLVVDV
jgi:hypothetical protein